MIGPPTARISIAADPRALDAGLTEAKSKFRAFGGSLGGLLKKGVSGIGSFLERTIDPVGRMKDLFLDQIPEVMEYERTMALLQVTQGKTADQMADLRSAVEDASSATAISKVDILKAGVAYQKVTNDTEGLTKAVQAFADTSEVTGATVDQVSAADAALKQIGVDAKDLEHANGILVSQARAAGAGAVAFDEMAGNVAALAPAFARFAGGKGVGAVAQMGAMMQVARKQTGSAEKAASGLNGVMYGIQKNAKKLAAYGIRVFDKHNPKQMRSLLSIVADIGKRGKAIDLSKIVRGEDARHTLEALRDNAGEVKRLMETADPSAIDKMKKDMDATPAQQIAKAFNDMKEAAAAAFTPDRIKDFAAAMEHLVTLVNAEVDGINMMVSAAENAKAWATGEDNVHLVKPEQLAKLGDVNVGEAGGDSTPELAHWAAIGQAQGTHRQERRNEVAHRRALAVASPLAAMVLAEVDQPANARSAAAAGSHPRAGGTVGAGPSLTTFDSLQRSLDRLERTIRDANTSPPTPIVLKADNRTIATAAKSGGKGKTYP